MRKNRLFTLLSFLSLSALTLQAQTYQEENGNYRKIGERSNQFNSSVSQLAPFDSAVYTYNSSTNALDKIYRLLYSSGASTWDSLSIEEYTYSSTSNYVQQTAEYKSFFGGNWVPNSQNITRYNTGGSLLLEQTNYWDSPSSSFVNSSKTEYVYDGNNRLMNRYNVQWTPGPDVWDTVGYTTYAYVGTSNRIDSSVQYNYNSTLSTFEPVNMNKYSYSGQNETVHSTFMYNTVTSSFFEISREERTYASNKVSKIDGYGINWADSTMFHNRITNNTYSGNLLTRVQTQVKILNTDTVFTDDMDSEYSYDGNNNLDGAESKYYDNANSQWVNNSKNTFDYNNGNYKTYEMYSAWIVMNSNYRDNVERFHHYELKPNISVAEQVKTKLSMFPNPTTDLLNVQYNSDEKVNFQVLSLDGKVVKSGMFTAPNNELTLNELNSGIYILKLTGESVKGSYKFIKM